MIRVAAAALLALAGCNLTFGLDEVDPAWVQDDAPNDAADGEVDAAAIDATDAADALRPDGGSLGPWTNQRLVLSQSMPLTDERAPAITPDGEQLYYQSSAGGTDDIYLAPRVGAGWGPSMLVPFVNTPNDDGMPRFTPAGTAMFLTSDRSGGPGRTDFWLATRNAPNGPWGTPQHVGVDSPFDDHALTPCSQTGGYVFASDRAGTGDFDLWEVSSLGVGLISVAATIADEDSPFITDDCLTLYFSSNVQGSYDLYVAHRDSIDLEFGDVQRIAELSNSENDEVDPWVSPDGHRILFAAGDGGSHELIQANR